jgi:NAD(P)-dependent dehydrogenase (short-subunit alcohol dehydrogenase family)
MGPGAEGGMSAATFPDLAGASVFVTGGGSGIGAALTEGFLRQGARVAFVGRSDYAAFADAMEAATGARPLAIRADVTDTQALRAAMDEAAAAHGPITRLINNAANDRRHETLEVDEDFYRWSTDINLKCYFFACQHAIRGLLEAGLPGAIVNTSSISYMMGNGGYPLYTASNAAITGLTRSLARECGPRGIRVNALAPGWVLTPKQIEMWATPEDLAGHLGRQCLKRHLAPEDIVAPTLFLASEASGMMTGQCIAVDGGVVTVAA